MLGVGADLLALLWGVADLYIYLNVKVKVQVIALIMCIRTYGSLSIAYYKLRL